MRGNDNTLTWYPSDLPPSSNDLNERLFQIYEKDKTLSIRLEQALETQKLAGKMSKSKQRGRFPNLAKSCAKLLSEPNGPSIAMLELNGWDTHSNQVNRLNRKFKELDQGIEILHNGLKENWENTTLLINSEFGRTVKINGTGGTDHGTATSMFIAGGAINGGHVLGKWPGLEEINLYQGRDLMPTSNTFDWIGKALQEHWQLSDKQISRIFPTS